MNNKELLFQIERIEKLSINRNQMSLSETFDDFDNEIAKRIHDDEIEILQLKELIKYSSKVRWRRAIEEGREIRYREDD